MSGSQPSCPGRASSRRLQGFWEDFLTQLTVHTRQRSLLSLDPHFPSACGRCLWTLRNHFKRESYMLRMAAAWVPADVPGPLAHIAPEVSLLGFPPSGITRPRCCGFALSPGRGSQAQPEKACAGTSGEVLEQSPHRVRTGQEPGPAHRPTCTTDRTCLR